MITPDTLRKLASLNLSPEQMAGVLEILAEGLEKEEKAKQAAAERKRKQRAMSRDSHGTVTLMSQDGHTIVAGQSRDSHKDTPPSPSLPPSSPPTVSPIPPSDTPPISPHPSTFPPAAHASEARAKSDFQKVFDEGCDLFPILMTANTSIIHAWLRAGCDPELDIIPELTRHKGKGISGWKFFTGGIMESKKTRETDISTPASPTKKQKEPAQPPRELTEEEREKNRLWYLKMGLHHAVYNPTAERMAV